MKTSMNTSLCRSANRINLNLLCFGHSTVDAGWHGRVSSPVFSRLYYILSGSFFIKGYDNRDFTLKEGNWYLVPSGYSFTYKCEESMEHVYTHVKLCDFGGTDLLKNCQSPLCLKIESRTPETIIKFIKSSHITDGLMLRQTFTEILLMFIREYNIPINTDDYSYFIYNAMAYIKQNLSMQLTISELADYLFVSKSTLTKHFRKELDMSVNEYICDTVMSEAERLLITTDISISELSQKLGFSDQFYFSRRFKEKFGRSPRQYRKIQPL